MTDSLEDFLKQAAARRKQQAGQAASQPATPPPRARKPEYSDKRKERAASGPSPEAPRRKSIQREKSPPISIDSQADTSTSAVGPRAGARSMRHLEANKLGADVGLADERMAEHLHERFDHALGALGGVVNAATADESVTTGPLAASSIEKVGRSAAIDPDLIVRVCRMLQTAHGIQEAIIVNEVLRRPVERWQASATGRRGSAS
jgi:hypothetical protein